MAEWLHMDPAAPTVAAKVAVSAQAAAPAESFPASPPAGVNPFDTTVTALLGWANATHEEVSGVVHTRDDVLGTTSASAFSTVAEMDTENAADLGEVGQER